MKNKDFFALASILFKSRINVKKIKNLLLDSEKGKIEDAYRIQDELFKMFLTLKNNKCIGKKVGCTNKEAQKQLKIKEPFYGSLFSKFSSESNCELLSKNFLDPYMEPEIAFKIKKDIDISQAPFNINQIINIIDSVVCSVEIVDFRYDKNLTEIGISNLIANNAASEFWIKNNKEFQIDDLDLSNHKVSVYINDKLVSDGNTSNVLDNPINSLLWIINKLSLKGEAILKNYFITTGTCTPAIPLKKNSDIKVDFGKIGNIYFKYI